MPIALPYDALPQNAGLGGTLPLCPVNRCGLDRTLRTPRTFQLIAKMHGLPCDKVLARRRPSPEDYVMDQSVLTINVGSSSIKFALFQGDGSPERGLHGKVDRIGLTGTTLSFTSSPGRSQESHCIAAPDHQSAANALFDWLEVQEGFASINAVGHRVVHGMEHTEPELVTRALLNELHRIELYDPDHLPAEIELIQIFARRYPKLTQVACFDTAFHRSMPRVASMIPLPRRYEAKGLRRYGFHGLSYAYLVEELRRSVGQTAAEGRVILAHLGNGASLAAVREGKSIDTSMGFTPAAGLPMSTRSGDIDPGIASFLERTEQMSASRFRDLVNRESGLLGISESSSDMRDLLTREPDDIRAAEAIDLFCYQAKKWIGAYAAALGGLDTLVFAGGIGENAAQVRTRICAGLGFLGLELDASRNAARADVISTDSSRVTVRVIRTDEEQMIARSVRRLLDTGASLKEIQP